MSFRLVFLLKFKPKLLEVVYSYWDGSGHRRSIQLKKGTTVGKFLEMVRLELTKEFSDLRTVGADGLIYIKEDLIIPQVREMNVRPMYYR